MVDEELELEELSIEESLTRMDLARFSFEEYCTYIDPHYRVIATQGGRNIHRELIEVYEAVAKGEIKRLMVQCPARLGKSELGGIKLPSWFLGNNPDKQFVLASYDANLASDFSRKARDIVKTPRYHNVFPAFQLAADRDTQTHWESSQRGGMYAVGVGGSLTGKGGDILYIDDPVKNMEEAQSPVIQEKLIDRYDAVLSTRKQDENSRIVLTMTRRDINDLAGYLQEQEKQGGESWHKVTIKAINDEGHPIIWPGKWGPDYFIKERETRSTKVRDALFQQDPRAMTGNIFKPGNERYFLESDFERADGILKKSDIILGMFVDPAFSTNIKSDDIVIGIVGMHKLTLDFYIFDVIADTRAPSEARNMMFLAAEKWQMKGFNKPFVSIENVTINKDQTKFYKDWLDAMTQRKQFFTTYQFTPKTDKFQRIRDELEPIWNLNKVYINNNMSGEVVKKMLGQLRKFPEDKHDDIPDMIHQAVKQLVSGISPQQETQEKPRVVYDHITNEPVRVVGPQVNPTHLQGGGYDPGKVMDPITGKPIL